MQQEINQIKADIASLRAEIETSKQTRTEDTNSYVNIRNIFDFVEVVSTVPTNTPQTFFEQIKFYSSGTTYRLYIYDFVNNVWRYTTLT